MKSQASQWRTSGSHQLSRIGHLGVTTAAAINAGILAFWGQRFGRLRYSSHTARKVRPASSDRYIRNRNVFRGSRSLSDDLPGGSGHFTVEKSVLLFNAEQVKTN